MLDAATMNYYKNLPRKPIGAAVIFFDMNDRLLIVKPSYKSGWLLVGGSVDADESPLHAAIREVKEELGLSIESLDFVCLHFMKNHETAGESIHIVFNGGQLTDEQIGQIQLPADELVEYRFVTVEEVIKLLRPGLAVKIEACLAAIESGCPIYLEHENG